jgi:hypothetical protein
VIVRPSALAALLRRTLVRPTSVVHLLDGVEAYAAFRAIVRELFPDAEAEILDARDQDAGRQTARVWAFCRKVEERYFPLYEAEEYEQLCDVPFVRNAWSYERLHDPDLPPGMLLLLVLCMHPYDAGTRIAALDAAEAHVPGVLLRELPPDGFDPGELLDRLAGTGFEAAADFAAWVFADIRSDLAALPTTDRCTDVRRRSA